MRILALAAIAVMCVVSVGTAVAAWDITDEQRIARRTHRSSGGGNHSESIDGRRNPELFFAYELFDHLLLGVSSDRVRNTNAHMLFDKKIEASGFDVRRFWSELTAIGKTYLATRETHRRERHNTTMLILATGQEVVVFVDRDVCRARLGALEAARHTFGRKEFDRLLYTVVAPEVSHSESSNVGHLPERLRFVAGGCK